MINLTAQWGELTGVLLAEDDAFRAELATARRATFEAGMNRVQALTARAVETLEDLLREKEHPSARLGAARTLVELGVSRHDAETIVTGPRQVDVQMLQCCGNRPGEH